MFFFLKWMECICKHKIKYLFTCHKHQNIFQINILEPDMNWRMYRTNKKKVIVTCNMGLTNIHSSLLIWNTISWSLKVSFGLSALSHSPCSRCNSTFSTLSSTLPCSRYSCVGATNPFRACCKDWFIFWYCNAE